MKKYIKYIEIGALWFVGLFVAYSLLDIFVGNHGVEWVFNAILALVSALVAAYTACMSDN
jgi:Na+-driven multidrug efflux pump